MSSKTFVGSIRHFINDWCYFIWCLVSSLFFFLFNFEKPFGWSLKKLKRISIKSFTRSQFQPTRLISNPLWIDLFDFATSFSHYCRDELQSCHSKYYLPSRNGRLDSNHWKLKITGRCLSDYLTFQKGAFERLWGQKYGAIFNAFQSSIQRSIKNFISNFTFKYQPFCFELKLCYHSTVQEFYHNTILNVLS